MSERCIDCGEPINWLEELGEIPDGWPGDVCVRCWATRILKDDERARERAEIETELRRRAPFEPLVAEFLARGDARKAAETGP